MESTHVWVFSIMLLAICLKLSNSGFVLLLVISGMVIWVTKGAQEEFVKVNERETTLSTKAGTVEFQPISTVEEVDENETPQDMSVEPVSQDMMERYKEPTRPSYEQHKRILEASFNDLDNHQKHAPF
jgi:hypothetical protein